MPSYIVRPRRPVARIWHDDGDDYFHGQPRQPITVHEPDEEPIETGLLDSSGNELMRKAERRPIGFGHAYD